MAILFEMTEEFRENLKNQGVVFEGSYKEGNNFYKLYVTKEFNITLKYAKKAMRKKDYKEAIKLFKKCKSLIPKLKEEANKISDDTTFTKFMTAIFIDEMALSKHYKNKKTDQTAYYRIRALDQIAQTSAYVDRQIEDAQDALNKK